MVINYDIQKISTALSDFYNATGIDIQLLRPDFSSVCENTKQNIPYCQALQGTAKEKQRCMLFDEMLIKKSSESKKTEMGVCHAGLLNVVIPLLYDDIIIGYIIFGRIKLDSQKDEFVPGKEEKNSAEIKKYYEEIPSFTMEKVKSVANIAEMLAKYLLLENMLGPSFSAGVQRVIEFIDRNLEKELSIEMITKSTHISKSVLYKNFHELFHCTVNDYIKQKRVERSVELMRKSELSIEQISQAVGFTSASYYSRIFKAQMGMSPIKYKTTMIG